MDAITDRCVVLKNLPCDTREEEVKGCLNDDLALRGKFKDVEKYEVLEDDVRWIVLFKNVNDAREIRAKKSWKWTLCGIECTVIADLCSECVIPQHWNLDMVSMESDESDWEKVKFPSHGFSDLSTHEPRSDLANHGSEGLPSNPSIGLPHFKQLDPHSLTSSSSWEPFTPFTSDRSERMDSDPMPALSGFDDSLPPAKDKPSTSFNSGTASITSDQLFGGDSTVSNDSRSDDQKMYGSARGGSTVNDVKLANLELNDVKDVRSDSQNSDSSGAAQFSPPSSSSDSFEIIKEPCSADKLFESSLILNDNMLVEDQGVKCSDKERTVGSRMMNKDAVTGTTMDLTKNSEEQSEVVKSHRKSPIREVHVTTLNNKNTGTNDMSDLRVVSSDSVRSDDLYGSGSGKQYSSGGFETFSNISSSEARQSTDTYEDDKANTHQARKDSDLKNPAIKEPATNLNPMSPTLSPFPNQASNTQQPHGPQFTMYGHGYATARFPKSMMADSNARSPSPVSPSFMPAMYPYPIAWPQQPGFPQAMGFPTQQAGFAAPQSGFPQQPGLPQQPGFPQHHQPFQSIPYMMPYGQRFDIQHAGSAVGNKTPDENRPENFENQKPAVSSGGTGEDKKDRPNTFGGIQAPKKKEIPKPPPVDKPIDHSMSEIKRMGLGNRSHLESKYYSKEPVYDEIPVDIDLGSLPPVIPPAMPDPKLKVSTDENSLIIVKGIPATTLVEEIELFFEHRRKSGGGAIKNIDFKPDKGQAVIEYKLSADATSVLEKATITDLKLPISGCKLTVGPYQPPPLDPNKIFVENIATITTDELMKLFLEAKTEMTPETVTRGQKTGTALVDFQIPPDIGRIQNMCKKYACQKQHWKVSPVEQTRRVKVTTTSRLPDPETIGLYFENKRKSQGGDVESVETSPIDDSCVVTFVDNKDAERVCEADKHHKVNNCELIVSLYYPCLDREPVIAIPPPIVVTHLDKNVVKFLNRSSTYRTKVEESLAKEYGEPVWTPADENGDIGFHIKCMVTETDAKAAQKIKRWSDNCVGTLDWVSHSVDSTDDILVAVEIWDAVKKDLATLEVRKPDCVLVFMENHLRSILVVGEAKLVGDVSRQICGVIEKIEETFDQENDVITKQLQLKHFEITLARASRLESKMQKENVQCEIKGDTRQIVLKGKKKNVDKALQRINDIRKSFVKKEVQGYSKLSLDLLFAKETRDHIKKCFSKEHLIGVWDVVRSERLFMYSSNDRHLQRVITILHDSLNEFSIPINYDVTQSTRGEPTSSFIQQLESRNPGLVKITDQRDHLQVACVDYLVDTLKAEVDKHFDLHRTVTEFITVDQGRFQYIMQHKRQDMENIEKQYSRLNVNIESDLVQKGFTVKGKKDGCKLAISKLQDLIVNLAHTNVVVNKPGFDRFIESDAGKDSLNGIEIRDKCVLKVLLPNSDDTYQGIVNPRQGRNDGRPYSTDSETLPNECRVGNCTIQLVAGDIMTASIDAIVTPSFPTLIYTLGLGAAIVGKGGQDIQRELDAIRKKTTNSPAFGNVYRTTGGRLPAKSIIHAVSPICNAGSDDEYSQLHRCLYNSLLKADQLGMRSIAFPPFGKGAYKFSSEKVAEYFVKAVKQYLTAANISPRLHIIIMYDKDGQTLDHVKRQLQAEGLMKGSNKVPDNQEEASGGVDMRRPTSRTIAIDVVDGSLVAQQADVIVNSTNTYLDLSVGVVSKQLLQAAGDSLQSECKSRYPQGIDYGQVASTKAGNMGNCKALFHGALPRWDKGQGQAEYALSTFVAKCLQKADSRGYRSIAFPALGTGACGYPRDLVASTMFEIVEAYSEKTPNSTLRNVSVVIWSEDHTTIRAFKDVQNNRKSARKSDGVRVSTYMMDSQNDIYASGSSYTLAIGPVSLSIVKADLTKQTTDVIVNSVLESLDLSQGILSKAILTAAGQSIQLECNTDAKKQALRTDGFVVTKQGRLMCKNILHMKARGTKTGWTESIVKALEQVEQHGHSSISFPALGTGGRGASPEDMAKAMYSAFKQYSCSGKYRGSLKFIRIVIYQAEMVERFVTVITELSKGKKTGGTFLDIFNKKKKDEDVGVGVTISIYTDSKHQADIVTRHIHDLHNVQDLIFPPTLMAKLKDYQVAKIQNCARDCRVKALKTSDGFKLLGFGNSVDTAKRKIKDYMYSIEKELKLAQAKSGIKLPPEWSRMSMADKTMVVTLKPTDLDYVKVAQHFTRQAGMVPPQIVKIERIQNPALYAQYYGKKKQMLDAGGTNVERWLWHGTKGGQAVADNISNNGFNRNYNSGASHGVGVYFAVQAAMSVNGYCLADAMGHKHIFYASVLTGDFCVGSGGIKVPPRKGVGITGMQTYDSTTDNIAAPNFFVIFHDSQAYPSYLITFR